MTTSTPVGRDRLIFFHAPNSRSAGVRALLEELGAPHELRTLDLKAGDQRKPEYLAVNPLGKVPAIVHDGALVTEQGAVYAYLADLFPEAGLAPPPGDRLRGPYLRWLFYYGSCFEPAVVDRALKREPAPPSVCPYGDYDSMLATVVAQLRPGPHLLGERFTAADVLWGGAFGWMLRFKLVPELPEIVDYAARVAARPAVRAAAEKDAHLAAAQAAAHPPAAGG
jgi:glutathione S-transferase